MTTVREFRDEPPTWREVLTGWYGGFMDRLGFVAWMMMSITALAVAISHLMMPGFLPPTISLTVDMALAFWTSGGCFVYAVEKFGRPGDE